MLFKSFPRYFVIVTFISLCVLSPLLAMDKNSDPLTFSEPKISYMPRFLDPYDIYFTDGDLKKNPIPEKILKDTKHTNILHYKKFGEICVSLEQFDDAFKLLLIGYYMAQITGDPLEKDLLEGLKNISSPSYAKLFQEANQEPDKFLFQYQNSLLLEVLPYIEHAAYYKQNNPYSNVRAMLTLGCVHEALAVDPKMGQEDKKMLLNYAFAWYRHALNLSFYYEVLNNKILENETFIIDIVQTSLAMQSLLKIESLKRNKETPFIDEFLTYIKNAYKIKPVDGPYSFRNNYLFAPFLFKKIQGTPCKGKFFLSNEIQHSRDIIFFIRRTLENHKDKLEIQDIYETLTTLYGQEGVTLHILSKKDRTNCDVARLSKQYLDKLFQVSKSFLCKSETTLKVEHEAYKTLALLGLEWGDSWNEKQLEECFVGFKSIVFRKTLDMLWLKAAVYLSGKASLLGESETNQEVLDDKAYSILKSQSLKGDPNATQYLLEMCLEGRGEYKKSSIPKRYKIALGLSERGTELTNKNHQELFCRRFTQHKKNLSVGRIAYKLIICLLEKLKELESLGAEDKDEETELKEYKKILEKEKKELEEGIGVFDFYYDAVDNYIKKSKINKTMLDEFYLSKKKLKEGEKDNLLKTHVANESAPIEQKPPLVKEIKEASIIKKNRKDPESKYKKYLEKLEIMLKETKDHSQLTKEKKQIEHNVVVSCKIKEEYDSLVKEDSIDGKNLREFERNIKLYGYDCGGKGNVETLKCARMDGSALNSYRLNLKDRIIFYIKDVEQKNEKGSTFVPTCHIISIRGHYDTLPK